MDAEAAARYKFRCSTLHNAPSNGRQNQKKDERWLSIFWKRDLCFSAYLKKYLWARTNFLKFWLANSRLVFAFDRPNPLRSYSTRDYTWSEQEGRSEIWAVLSEMRARDHRMMTFLVWWNLSCAECNRMSIIREKSLKYFRTWFIQEAIYFASNRNLIRAQVHSGDSLWVQNFLAGFRRRNLIKSGLASST